MRRVVPLFVLAAGLAVLAPRAKAEIEVFDSGDDLVVSYGIYVPGEPSVPEILVTQAGNLLLIEGLNGTLVEGTTAILRAFPQDDIRIDLLAGHVTVRDVNITGRPTDDLIVETYGRVRVEGYFSMSDAGADVVIRDSVDVRIWGSATLGRLSAIDVRRLTVDVSAFDRSVAAVGTDFADMFKMRTVWLGDKLELSTGRGRDEIDLEDVSVVDLLKIHAGHDNDWLYIDRCHVGRHWISGGYGSDTIYADDNGFPLTTFNTHDVEYVK